MADATRLQTLSKQNYERKQHSDELDRLFASLEASWTKTLSQGSWNSPIHIQEFNSSPSNTITVYPRPPQPPDPPDFNQFGQRLSKSEFPKFDGTLFREWLRRCDQYFYLHKTLPEMKVRIASHHMIGKALEWHNNYIRNNFGMFPPWLDYTIAITAHFGDNDALPMHRAPFSPYQNYNDQPYYEREFGKCPEIEFVRENDEIKDEKLQDKQPEEYVKIPVMSENEQSLECVGDEPSDDEKPGEVIVEEIIDKSVDMTQEVNSTPENESSPIVSPQILLSQFQVPLSSMEPSPRYLKESLVVVNDLSYDLECVISKTNGCICDSELGQANSHDGKKFKGLNLGMLLRDEWLLSIVCLLGLNDMSCWTQLLRQQILPKSWRFKFKTESSGEAILLNTYRAVRLGCCCYEYKNQMLLLGYHGLEVQVLSCLQEFGEGSKTDTPIALCWKKLASFLWFLHGKKLLVMGVKQLILAATKFHVKHKWRSRLLQTFSELKQWIMVSLWKSFGYLMEAHGSKYEGRVYGIDKKKLMNVEDNKKDKKLDHNLIDMNFQICCCVGGLYRQRGTVYDAENLRLLDTKDGINEIILKGLCVSGFEMETWTVKKSLEWLNKLSTAINLAHMFLDHVCKLQGTPQDRLSDKDSTFLIELFRVRRADLSSDTTYEFIFAQPQPVHFPFGLEETSFAAVMDRYFQKKEELIAMSTVHLSRGLVQWKEHPPD